MKANKRIRVLLGVDSSFFPRARKAEERLRRQSGQPGESSQRNIWEFIDTPVAGTPTVEPSDIMRPGFQPRGYTRVDPNQWFDVPAMWTFVDQTRRTPGYAGQAFLVDILTRPAKLQEHALGEIAQFFGIPSAAFQGKSVEQAWVDVVRPMFDEFEAVMNRAKPAYVSGVMRFDLSPQNELAVVYYDR